MAALRSMASGRVYPEFTVFHYIRLTAIQLSGKVYCYAPVDIGATSNMHGSGQPKTYPGANLIQNFYNIIGNNFFLRRYSTISSDKII